MLVKPVRTWTVAPFYPRLHQHHITLLTPAVSFAPPRTMLTAAEEEDGDGSPKTVWILPCRDGSRQAISFSSKQVAAELLQSSLQTDHSPPSPSRGVKEINTQASQTQKEMVRFGSGPT